MGILHPDNREYATGAPVASGAAGTTGHHHLGGGVNPATHIPAAQTTATGPAPNTAGPHRHDVLNKLDPTVDSDLSKTAAAHNHQHKHNVSPAVAGGVGAAAGAGLAHHHNHHTPHTAHPGATTASYNNNGGLGTAGAGVGGAGLGHSAATTGRHHNGGVGGVGGGGVQATAGPHNSDLANRLDPTVDSRTGLRKQI